MELKEIRKSKNLTQLEASKILHISLRSYKSYENDISKQNTVKYLLFSNILKEYQVVTEDHGILSIDDIKRKSKEVFDLYDINFAYLFGSYAKGYAEDKSDVDVIVDTEVTGLKFFGLIERLRQKLNKKIDLLKLNDLLDNEELLREIMKYGIKIYDNEEVDSN